MAGLVAGLILATGPAAFWLLGGAVADAAPPGPAPQVASVPLADPVPPGPPPGATTRAPAPRAVTAPVRVPAPPVRVRVAALRVDAAVVATGVDPRGGMEIPHDIHTVGWYRFGTAPGAAAGSAVLAGHVDDRVQGYGAFHRLAALAAGDPVQVVLADGTVVGYRVSTVERTAKTALPAARLFARDGPPRLALVTCGGQFDPRIGGYTDNVVVTAVPEKP